MRFPMFGGLWPIRPRDALRDAFAGLTLASMNIPQVLGYTRIAGTPVVTGLYTVLLPLVAFAVFGSSRHLVVAADSATAAIFASSLSRMAEPASAHYMALVGMVALLTAGLLVLARIFKLGFLADFLSRTALIGFLTGVGVQVGTAMLGDMVGVAVASRRTLVQLWQVFAGSAVARSKSAWPFALCRRQHPARQEICAEIPGFARRGRWSDRRKRLAPSLGPRLFGHRAGPGRVAFAEAAPSHVERNPRRPARRLSCFVMIIAQSAATSRVYAIRHQERVDENADILGLAAANAAAAVSGAFVVNGSPTQTAMADGAGARSQVAQLAFSAIVLIVLLFLTGPLQYLPHCVLASIVFTIAVGMVDVEGLRGILQESRGEFMLATATAAAVVAVGVEQGILFAIGFSLVRHVRHSYEAHSMVLVPDASGRWEPAPARPGLQTEPGLIVYRYGADLFYANADRFADQVRELVEKAPDAGQMARLSTPKRSETWTFRRRKPSALCWKISIAKAFASSSAASTRTCCRI